MKKLSILLVAIFIATTTFSQKNEYNLESKNLHKKVRKTSTNYYAYDNDSGGFVLRSINIERFNDDGNLVETLYQYNGSYSASEPTKKLYQYNNKEQLIYIQDISSKKSSYAVDIKFTYNNDGNVVKKESIYSDGSKFYSIYEYDRRERLIKIKDYSKENKLTAETNISYDGRIRREKRTSFNSKDGSIYGTYTTIYKNDVKTEYLSNSKYGNSKTTYTYNDENDLISSNYFNKTSSISNYNYEYDRKDNWIKKHYRNGKYQYFYFREIIFDNGDISGSDAFDSNYINMHGNFTNVAVVPIKMKKIKKKNSNTTSSDMPSFATKNWSFNTIKIGEKTSELIGTCDLKVKNSNKMDIGAKVNFSLFFKGKKTEMDVTILKYSTQEKSYFWTFEDDAKTKVYLSIFKNKIGKIDAVLTIGEGEGKTLIFLN
ncbi:hypothetical protein [Polaribacter aestuariivivens]|uniref:hypothetical protein n=1 Tax=Polaribacter aestuariivivens TaxID=2304626 RepID=UPI003F49908A